MGQKPLHYDGSVQAVSDEEIYLNEQLIITDEIRKNFGFNPYFSDSNE
ncbi:hypothetical protein LIT25_12910 [Bacillus sp. F19]|nr:hypothetical protein LIT25_12910 [Bacillus sp. F19]